MKIVVIKVKYAKLTSHGEIISEIGHGLVVQVGINPTDTKADAQYLAERLLSYKLWHFPCARWSKNIKEMGF